MNNEVKLSEQVSPEALKSLTRRFEFNLSLSEKEVLYSAAQEAVVSPVANKIFGFPWTQSVRVGPNFVEVTCQDWISWDVLAEPLMGLLKEHVDDAVNAAQARGLAHIEENGIRVESKLNSSEAQIVQRVLDEEVNPAVASHGGHIRLIDIQGDVLYIQMGGGCQGCGQADATLKQGVEGAIRGALPQIRAVYDVTDHAGGTNPYYRP